MARPNHQFAKRQREIAKKKKKEEKRQRKIEQKSGTPDELEAQPAEDATRDEPLEQEGRSGDNTEYERPNS